LIFSAVHTRTYQLYPFEQRSIARDDTHQYIANISLPITDLIRKDIEHYLTSFNPRMYSSTLNQSLIFILTEFGIAKIVYTESINTNQTRFYITVR